MQQLSAAPRWPRVAVALLSAGVLCALAVLWTGSADVGTAPATSSQRGEVVAAAVTPCRVRRGAGCRRVEVKLASGPRAGQSVQIRVGESLSELDVDVGDDLRVVRNENPAGADSYTITDFERRTPLLWLLALFVTVVLAIGGRRGVRALVGLGLSLLIVFGFVVPAILDGRPPALVALVGALAIMLATVVCTHGAGPKSIAAILGTTASLAVTVGLGAGFVELAHLTGLSSDASALLLAGREDLSLEGIVLAGLVIGALGVLDDVTVSQASTVLALRKANSGFSARELYRRGLDVGQDHASATVNTLVLAYVGTALPVLLIFSGNGAGFGDAVNSEPVAQELVAMLAGSVGLMTAVPLTTALSAWLAVRLPVETLPDEHVHTH